MITFVATVTDKGRGADAEAGAGAGAGADADAGAGGGVGSGSGVREGGLGVAADQNPPPRHLTKVESLSNIF